MKIRKRSIVLFLCALTLALGGLSAHGAEQVIRVGYPAPAGAFLPLWMANDGGLFKKRGISVEVISTPSSPQAIASMFAGQLDILAGGGTGGVTTQLKGYKDMAFFGNIINTFVFSVYTHPSITQVSQLRGKKMGVTQFGGTLDFAARYYVKKSGLEPGRDVAFIQIGRMPDIVTALAAGSVEAGTIGVPQTLLAKKQGLRELADLSEIGARYALAGLVAKRSFLEKHRPQMIGFTKALVEAIHQLRTRPKEGMEIMSRYTKITEPEILKPAYDLHIKLFPRAPEISPEDLKLVLEEVAATHPEARQTNPADLIDDRIMQEVIKSGFVDQLYR